MNRLSSAMKNGKSKTTSPPRGNQGGNPEQDSARPISSGRGVPDRRVYHAQMETKSVVCKPEADGGSQCGPRPRPFTTCANSWDTFQVTSEQGQREANHRGRVFRVEHPDELRRAHRGSAGPQSAPAGETRFHREEDFYSHVKYPSLIRLKLGARKDGTLAAAI